MPLLSLIQSSTYLSITYLSFSPSFIIFNSFCTYFPYLSLFTYLCFFLPSHKTIYFLPQVYYFTYFIYVGAKYSQFCCCWMCLYFTFRMNDTFISYRILKWKILSFLKIKLHSFLSASDWTHFFWPAFCIPNSFSSHVWSASKYTASVYV